MTSTSGQGNTRLTLQFRLDRNIDAAFQDVQAAVSAAGTPIAARHALPAVDP
jgi:HAE1 family hydrophobic/amphiphilic exporter-1